VLGCFEAETGIGGLLALEEDGEQMSAALGFVEFARGDFRRRALFLNESDGNP
jgi:hypothetical protein